MSDLNRDWYIDYILHTFIPYNIDYKYCRLPNKEDIDYLRKNNQDILTLDKMPFWVKDSTSSGKVFCFKQDELEEVDPSMPQAQFAVRLVFEFDDDVVKKYLSPRSDHLMYKNRYLYVCGKNKFMLLTPELKISGFNDAVPNAVDNMNKLLKYGTFYEAYLIDSKDSVKKYENDDDFTRCYLFDKDEQDKILSTLEKALGTEFLILNYFTGQYVIYDKNTV